MIRAYSFRGLAGCVVQRVSRETGALVGLYHADQAGLDSDPANPWATVCEAHSNMVTHASLRLARLSLAAPSEWCEACREAKEGT